jgi:tRNA A-37 threonylcarbamoyl transferase component Bud32
MAFVEINPRYQVLVNRMGLRTPADFYQLQGPFVGGHAERDVARVTLEHGIGGYLKREHRVRWRDRLRSALGGFGFISRCHREAKLLRRLQRQGIGCPEVIATGEDDNGRSFLLVHQITNGIELRHFLSQARLTGTKRRRFAMQLGHALARIHQAGFYHRDLYSKHVLIRMDAASESDRFVFVDWQRSQLGRRLAWSCRRRDLAALDATLADGLASPRDRLACLAAYCDYCKREEWVAVPTLRRALRAIRALSRRLQRRQRIAGMRQPLRDNEPQSLIKPAGRCICLTRRFRDELCGELPPWLELDTRSPRHHAGVTSVMLPVAQPRPGTLVRRQVRRPLWRLSSWLASKAFVSPEVRQADTLFRLERYGIRAPRLLAFGHQVRSWRCIETLLLTEDPAGTVPLMTWLKTVKPHVARRRSLLYEAGLALRRMHSAACFFSADAKRLAHAVRVQKAPDGLEHIVLGDPQAARRQGRPIARLAIHDLAMLHEAFARHFSGTDGVRFLLAYLDRPHLDAEVSKWICRIRRAQRRTPRALSKRAAP